MVTLAQNTFFLIVENWKEQNFSKNIFLGEKCFEILKNILVFGIGFSKFINYLANMC
jgi:hypothetical protein